MKLSLVEPLLYHFELLLLQNAEAAARRLENRENRSS